MSFARMFSPAANQQLVDQLKTLQQQIQNYLQQQALSQPVPFTILICDDNLINRKCLERALRNCVGANAQILLAKDSNEAINYARSQPIHLVFMDYEMGSASLKGDATAAEIKKVLGNMPYIATWSDTPGMKRYDAANDSLTKPLNIMELPGLVAKSIQYKELLSGVAQKCNTPMQNFIFEQQVQEQRRGSMLSV